MQVPTCTARDMTEQVSSLRKIVKWWKINEVFQVLAFLRGELKMTEYSFLKQVGTRSFWIISTFIHFVFP